MSVHPSSPQSSTLSHGLLDSSFAAIEWQVPWLYHVSQLDYLSDQVRRLSAEDGNFKNNANHDATIIADLLNTAMTQQDNNYQNQLQTKPHKGNQTYALKFVPQNTLPEGEGYEHFIATTGSIPTRDNLHDLFNGSIWLTFPKTKALLNYHHMLEINKGMNKQSIGDSRGRVRDTITVFDENGAILVTCVPSIGEALIAFDWQASLVLSRDKWDNPSHPKADAQTTVYIFGHALLEQLVQPRKSLCAHSVVINVASRFFDLCLSDRIMLLDDKLAKHMDELLSQKNVTPRQLAPLPILGVPHFWADNVDTSFYQDDYVFRSGRRQKT